MKITQLKEIEFVVTKDKAAQSYDQLKTILSELENKNLADYIIKLINQDIEELNSITQNGDVLRKALKQKQSKILKLLEKELKIVPKNHYRNLWLAVGMSAFGLPIGLILSKYLDNRGLTGIGLPIGMGIGVLVGSTLDKKALEEGRQLNVEIK